MRHFIDTKELDAQTVDTLFKLADSLAGKRNDSLKGKILATLFYEPSTRTRLSFESAMFRLGGDVLSSENASDNSSAFKGETLEDTLRMISGYADIAVVRHSEAGSVGRAVRVSNIPIVNAGDGGNEHPTQALIDAYTIRKELGTIEGKQVVIVGDAKHSRAIRSFAEILALFPDVTITFVSPQGLEIGDDVKSYLSSRSVSYSETDDLSGSISQADVLYTNRIQKERFAEGSAQTLEKSFVVTRSLAENLRKGSIIMNPLPRIDELETDVDSLESAAYFRQAENGVSVRMALISFLLK